jgi:hypothetical protein
MGCLVDESVSNAYDKKLQDVLNYVGDPNLVMVYNHIKVNKHDFSTLGRVSKESVVTNY